MGSCLFPWKYSFIFCSFWNVGKELANHESCILLSALGLGHHHLAELIKVHGAGAVLQTTDHLLFFCWLAEKLSNFVGCYLVQLLNDSFQLLVCERGEQLSCTKS